ncbi:phosphoenolpyruvate synthase, partial [Caerostris extrusa]
MMSCLYIFSIFKDINYCITSQPMIGGFRVATNYKHAIWRHISAISKRHGHRCIQESDVRSITWEMEPKSLVKLLQNLAGAGKEVAKNKNDIDKVLSELQVPLGFISKCYLRFVLPMCRRGIRGREAGK